MRPRPRHRAVPPLLAAVLAAAPATTRAVNRDEPLVPVFQAGLHGGLVAAGCGLRGAGPPTARGQIDITGVPADATPLHAILTWSVLAGSAPDPTIAFGPTGSPPSTLTGTSLGDDEPPCWANHERIHGFSAVVTDLLTATGAGTYEVEVADSGDPDLAPSVEGAALLIVYCSPSSPPTDVVIYQGLETQSSGSSSQTIGGFDAAATLARATAVFVVADGQGDRLRAPGASAMRGTAAGSSARVNGSEVIAPFAGDEGECAAPDKLYWDVDSVDVAGLLTPGATSLSATVESNGDCLTWSALAVELDSDTVDDAGAGCPVSSCSGLTAATGPDRTVCLGAIERLDGGTSIPCSGATLEYRWLDGATEVCPWSTSPTCDVGPLDRTTTYTLEVRCVGLGCEDSSTVTITVDPAELPPDLGNTLRAVRVTGEVALDWASEPRARAYALHRSESKGVWTTALRSGLVDSARSEPDVAWPPRFYLYRVAGENCSGDEGP